MADRGKILTGLVIFLLILAAPTLYNLASGKARSLPDLETGTAERRCVEETGFMRSRHMVLLNEWKDLVVRQGVRTYRAKDGTTHVIGMTGTCLRCHSDKARFCDRCHDYTAVRPTCWECHNVPVKTAAGVNGKRVSKGEGDR